MAVVAGVDFGTQSVRVSIVDSERGPIGAGVAEYPVKRDRRDPDFATQSHAAHMDALAAATRRALADAKLGRHERRGDRARHDRLDRDSGRRGSRAARRLLPLVRSPRQGRGGADHAKSRAREKLPAIETCGGVYSSEWGFAKLLHWLRHNPDKRDSLRDRARALRHGRRGALWRSPSRENVPRSVCAMGHKWLWSESNGGLPSEEFLTLGRSAARRRSRQARRALSDLRPHRRPAQRRVGDEARVARRDSDSGRRVRRALGRDRRRHHGRRRRQRRRHERRASWRSRSTRTACRASAAS